MNGKAAGVVKSLDPFILDYALLDREFKKHSLNSTGIPDTDAEAEFSRCATHDAHKRPALF